MLVNFCYWGEIRPVITRKMDAIPREGERVWIQNEPMSTLGTLSIVEKIIWYGGDLVDVVLTLKFENVPARLDVAKGN